MKHLLKLSYYHWPTTMLHTPSGFLYLFSLKHSVWFQTKTLVAMVWLYSGRNHVTLPEFHNIFISNYHVAFEILRDKIFVSKWSKKLFQSGAASATFYFKVGQGLFQGGAETVISKYVNVFQCGSKWGKSYFKVGKNFISKRGSYFKVGHNACYVNHVK